LFSLLLLSLDAAAQELPEGLSALPELLEYGDVVFPEAALEAEAQADVLIRITIEPDGSVIDPEPVALVLYTFDELDELVETQLAPDQDEYGFVPLAVDAVSRFTFSPALDDLGEPTSVRLVWQYGFYFEEEEVEVEVEPEVNFMGTVLDRETRLPLAGAAVEIQPSGVDVEATLPRTTFVDPEGRFTFADVPSGDWRVTLRLAGYEVASAVETITTAEITDVTYYLEPELEGDYTYDVVEQAVRREVSRRTLSVTEINRIPGNNGDPIKVVQNLPGFARPQFNGGLIVIRGSAPEDSRVYIGGVLVPLVFHFGGLTSIINAELLDELEYLPGAFSVEYGRATGGVINVETRAPRTDAYHASIDADVFDAGLLIEGPIADDWSFFVAGRRSYIDAILPAVLPEDAGLTLTVAPRYYDYQAKIQWEPSVEHSLNLFAFGSDDRLEFLLEEAPGDDPAARGNIETGTSFHRVRLEVESEVASNISNRAVAATGPQRLEFFLGDDLRFVLSSMNYFFRDTVTFDLSDRLTLRTGVDLDMYSADLSIVAPRPPKEGEQAIILGSADVITAELDDIFLVQEGLFVEAEWELVDDFTLISGLRLDYYDTTAAWVGGWSLDPRLALRWEVTDQWALEAAAGIFHEPPTPDETSEDFGNPELDLEWAVHYVIGAEYSPLEYLDVELQLFYKDLRDLVARSDDIVERRGQEVAEVYDNDGVGRIYGAEFLFRHELANNFFGWVSYTLSRSERRDASGEDYRLFTYDQTHILSLIGSYQLPRNWSIGLRWRYVTGNPDTPLTEGTYDADADAYVRVAGPSNSIRVGAFHALDVRIDKEWHFTDWNLALYLDVSNTYNRQNPEALNYNFDYSESQVISSLPIIPSLGLRAWF